jgi:helix-turn-helix protein
MGIKNKWEDEKIIKVLDHLKSRLTEIKEYFEKHPEKLEEDESKILIDL